MKDESTISLSKNFITLWIEYNYVIHQLDRNNTLFIFHFNDYNNAILIDYIDYFISKNINDDILYLALILASQLGNLEIVTYLLEKDAYYEDLFCLYEAIDNNHLIIVKYLYNYIKKKENNNFNNIYNPEIFIQYTIERNNFEIFKFLMDEYILLNFWDKADFFETVIKDLFLNFPFSDEQKKMYLYIKDNVDIKKLILYYVDNNKFEIINFLVNNNMKIYINDAYILAIKKNYSHIANYLKYYIS